MQRSKTFSLPSASLFTKTMNRVECGIFWRDVCGGFFVVFVLDFILVWFCFSS